MKGKGEGRDRERMRKEGGEVMGGMAGKGGGKTYQRGGPLLEASWCNS